MQKEQYLELKYFCLQYSKKKAEANTSTAKGRRALIDITLIEQIAEYVYPEVADYIVESVTTGKSWEQLNVPCGRRQFYNARNRFFNLLSKMK